MDALTIQEAAETTGWSPRMLRYVERVGLVEPNRSASGYRLYGPAELQRLRTLKELLGIVAVGWTLGMFVSLIAEADSLLKTASAKQDSLKAQQKRYSDSLKIRQQDIADSLQGVKSKERARKRAVADSIRQAAVNDSLRIVAHADSIHHAAFIDSLQRVGLTDSANALLRADSLKLVARTRRPPPRDTTEGCTHAAEIQACPPR